MGGHFENRSYLQFVFMVPQFIMTEQLFSPFYETSIYLLVAISLCLDIL